MTTSWEWPPWPWSNQSQEEGRAQPERKENVVWREKKKPTTASRERKKNSNNDTQALYVNEMNGGEIKEQKDASIYLIFVRETT